MNHTLTFTPAEVEPSREAVLENLGIPGDAAVPDRIEELYATASQLLQQSLAPRGILAEIAVDDFATVYRGEGLNESPSVVADIFLQADHLALFTVTLGDEAGQLVGKGFADHDFALAAMLDAIASESADRTAELAERRYERSLREEGWGTADSAVVRYSPGYCGWDVTGQKQLFRYLVPERIGVTLTDSCLMQPLKSVSGVLIAGRKEIHRFPPTYSFCRRCETQECRERLAALMQR